MLLRLLITHCVKIYRTQPKKEKVKYQTKLTQTNPNKLMQTVLSLQPPK